MQHAGHDNPIHLVVDTFRLVAETHRQAKEIADSARIAVKQFYRDPKQLAVFIERHQTPVYVLENPFWANLCLSFLGFEPGFIPPTDQKRFERLKGFLTSPLFGLLAGRHSAKSHCHFEHGVIVVTPKLFTVGYLSHQLHHWLAFRSGMQGYNDRSQALYKKFWNEQSGELGTEVYNMSFEDMADLKAAINRDLEALQFLRQVASEILIPAKQAQRFATGSTSA